MGDDIEKIFENILALKPKDRNRLMSKLKNGLQKKNKSYVEIIPQVREYLIQTGTMTSAVVVELGLAEERMHNTAFKRCIVEKLGLKVTEAKIGRTVYYNLDTYEGTKSIFTELNTELLQYMIDQVDKRVKRVDIVNQVDFNDPRTPVLRDKKQMPKLRNMLRREMAKIGYENIGSRLEFVKTRGGSND